MGSETDQLKANVEARREELAATLKEIGERVDVSRSTFFAGMFAGMVLLALLRRIFSRGRKKR